MVTAEAHGSCCPLYCGNCGESVCDTRRSVDDHPLFVEALRAAVERAGIQVVGTANRGDELMELMETVETDAVLLDLAMPASTATSASPSSATGIRQSGPSWSRRPTTRTTSVGPSTTGRCASSARRRTRTTWSGRSTCSSRTRSTWKSRAAGRARRSPPRTAQPLRYSRRASSRSSGSPPTGSRTARWRSSCGSPTKRSSSTARISTGGSR